MDPTNIRELIQALLIEVLRFRYWIILSLVVISIGVLGAGYLMPKQYVSKVVLYADVSNIIGGLLDGKAEITRIDRSREVRDTIYTNRMLTSTARQAGFENPQSSIGELRNNIRVRSRGDYVDIEYISEDRDLAFTVVSSITDLFIQETARKKREESQGAFEFIDSQVQSYKQQLEAAEQRLKEFSAQNIDVSEQSVSSRVSTLKRDIQIIELELQDAQARMASYEQQLAGEPQFLSVESAQPQTLTNAERQLEIFEQRLSNLRLSYLDTHPDIVSLISQIDSLKQQIADEQQARSTNKTFEQIENPAYTNLKDVLNQERADITAKQQRLRNLNQLLAIELENAEVVAEKQATYAELTRDYGVTKGVYDDMLKRRENARLSMTLDVQGQGVNYKIHEPPVFPVNWEGLQLKHYAMAGPILGLAFPIGLIGLFVLFDPRVRSVSFMEQGLPPQIEMITEVPVYDNIVTQYSSKRSLVLLVAFSFVFLAVYGAVGLGVDLTTLL